MTQKNVNKYVVDKPGTLATADVDFNISSQTIQARVIAGGTNQTEWAVRGKLYERV